MICWHYMYSACRCR